MPAAPHSPVFHKIFIYVDDPGFKHSREAIQTRTCQSAAGHRGHWYPLLCREGKAQDARPGRGSTCRRAPAAALRAARHTGITGTTGTTGETGITGAGGSAAAPAGHVRQRRPRGPSASARGGARPSPDGARRLWALAAGGRCRAPANGRAEGAVPLQRPRWLRTPAAAPERARRSPASPARPAALHSRR